ncbi:hypothetical protein FH972_024264 [Carpinus fangiana]|uniref:Pectinesterase inhibitor domain-containing protein n=1 Tax=Carpinus fangiana TaxID=176857 RepID=A0A5N6KY96_9ROSI|nr:hypothetical protein FH972_024264 [Carpinus fangiana]
MHFITASLFLLCAFATAAPHPKRRLGGLTLDKLLLIAPKSASCDAAPYASECSTAAQALPHIVDSFNDYDITHPSVQAALVATMAYESAEFVYNRNHFPSPGRPGQGTKAMMMPEFTAEYAASLSLSSTGDAQAVADAVEQPQYTFGAAAWYITTKCDFSVREAMWGGSESGWEAYVTGCLGTTVDEGRKAYWQKAIEVLGSE